MKIYLKTLLLIFFIASTGCATSQSINGLYVNTFGKPTDPAVLFVHGGPGFNSADFEVTTANSISKLGFYVVVYDQRGQGRSDVATNEAFYYKSYATDIKSVIDTLNLNSPVLIGHSHGGPIAIKFDEYYPNTAKYIVLVSAPVDFWNSMQVLYDNCSARYTSGGFIQYQDELAKNFDILKAHKNGSADLIDPTSNVFLHGLFGCKLYNSKNPTDSEKQLRQLAMKYSAPMEQNSMPGFLLNESYIYQNHFNYVVKNKGRFFAIYGDEDGLFTPATLNDIRDAVNDEKSERFFLVSGASHSVFMDQNEHFLNILLKILKN